MPPPQTAKELLEELRGGEVATVPTGDARELLEQLRSEQRPARKYPFLTDEQSRRADEIGNPTAAVSEPFRQGMSLGFGDELAAAGRAAIVSPFDERTFGEVYGDTMREQREDLEQARKDHPVIAAGSEMAGAVLPSAKAGNLALSTAKNVPAWLKLMLAGGVEGGIYGAGTGAGGEPEGAEPGSRLASGATSAAVGAALTPLGLAAAPVLGFLKNTGVRLARRLTDTPRRQAERLASNALRTDLADPESVTRLTRAGTNSPLVLADVGENTLGLARGAHAKPGPFRTDANRMLVDRQQGQQGRLIQALGIRGPQQFKDNLDDWASSRITAAKPKYDEAYAASFNASSPQMQALLAKPAMRRALIEAERKIANEGGIKGGNVQRLDFAKRALDDMIGAAQREGKGDEARILGNIKRELVAEVDRQVPAYAQARAIFAGEAAMREAADFGSSLFKRNVPHDEARRLVDDMADSELEAFRRGALRGLIEQLETTPESRNAAQKLIESTAVRDKLRLLFKDEDSFARFAEQAADEAQMTHTRNRVLAGSPTARIQEETRALEGAGEIAFDVATGNKLGAFSGIMRAIGFGDVAPETLEELSKLLLEKQSPQTLARLQRAAQRVPIRPLSAGTRATIATGTGAMGGALAGNVQRENSSRLGPLVTIPRLARATE